MELGGTRRLSSASRGGVVRIGLALCLLCIGGFAAPRAAHAVAPCTKTWDGGAGTPSWHAADNWSPNGVPGASDHVCLPNLSPNYLVEYSTGTTSILSIQV